MHLYKIKKKKKPCLKNTGQLNLNCNRLTRSDRTHPFCHVAKMPTDSMCFSLFTITLLYLLTLKKKKKWGNRNLWTVLRWHLAMQITSNNNWPEGWHMEKCVQNYNLLLGQQLLPAQLKWSLPTLICIVKISNFALRSMVFLIFSV